MLSVIRFTVLSVIKCNVLSVIKCTVLRGPGGLHQNSLEIDFVVVSDGGE